MPRSTRGENLGFTIDRETGKANAARIVACVNALAGLNPDAVADVVKALEDLSGFHTRNANGGAFDVTVDEIDSMWEAAREALARLRE